MRLDGYRCDECKAESRDKTGNWFQVTQVIPSQTGNYAVTMTYSTPATSLAWHYCSAECLGLAAKRWAE